MLEILNQIEKLRLDYLSEEWVQAIYYSEFLEVCDLPPEYEISMETCDLHSVFLSIMDSFNYWLHDDPNYIEERSWARLSHEIQHQKLLTLLAFHIDYGTKNVLTKEYRISAVLASRLYYKLLSIPGYKAYHIYHSQLFAHSLACLSFPKTMCDNEETYFNIRELIHEVNSTIKGLQDLALDLKAIIRTLQLNPSDMNFEDILSNLVNITGGAVMNKLNIDKIELNNLCTMIYEMIDTLMCDQNGVPNVDAIQILFKCLLPKLISASVDSRAANNLVRASYVTYSGLLLSKYGKAALKGYNILLEHLCFTQDGLERAEVRTARMSLVIGLMSLLPHKSYRDFVKWLLKLSSTSKVSHRQIALEILYKLLSNSPEVSRSATDSPGNTNNEAPDGTNENNDQEDREGVAEANVQEIEPPAVSDNISTEDESSQEPLIEEELSEEEIADLLRQRPHTVPHAEILRAVYDRVEDVSSALRMRALVILTDCIDSPYEAMKNAIKNLNGAGAVSRLVAVGARCVCDERAVVRRAAASLVHRLLATAPSDPAPNDLGILVGLCRDASILVRGTAITALGELVIQKPSEHMIDAFLTGPMHQLSDPEIKIQDQVANQIQQILFERLRRYSAEEFEDSLPWLFLSGITRHNMRRHLQKACTFLNKTSKCINYRVVDILSTHLGLSDDHDLQCLVLLTSVSRYVECSDLSFLINYYYKLDDDARNRDVRLLTLSVELLTQWSRWLRADERDAMRHHLVQRLAAVSLHDGCRMACAMLAAHLDADNLQWATELMQISERRALNGGSVEEWVRAADLSLVAPVPPSSGLLQLFLNALAEPPPEWSASERGECVAGVGRLCVRSRAAAAAAAPPLATLLSDESAPLTARLNSLLALTDICVRYTCIVEPLLGSVCACVSRGTSPPLRRAAARALTRLLLAGYLRLRTPLYYRYCALLADEDHDVREPAEYYVASCLTADAIYHHFVDCVLYYNNDDEDISFDARQLIYDVMLQRLSLVQRLNVQCRLAREVLQHAADVTDEGDGDGDGELPRALNAALLDTITLLCGPRMKLPKKPQNSGDVADIDDLHERVTTNIVSHKMKRTVAEVLVPAVLRLYGRMRPRGGQLAAYLVRIATDLLNDYRQEIEELIENDEELVERIQQFQETIGLEPSFGNSRNLVTTSAPPDSETPRFQRKRVLQASRQLPRKRTLRF